MSLKTEIASVLGFCVLHTFMSWVSKAASSGYSSRRMTDGIAFLHCDKSVCACSSFAVNRVVVSSIFFALIYANRQEQGESQDMERE